MTNVNKDQTLMSPVVKLGNEMKEPGKEEVKRIIKHAIAASSQWPVPAHGPLVQPVFPLFLHFPQLRSAGHRNCLLWFLQPAVRQDITLHSLPLSGSVWVGVCERVGRCAPQTLEMLQDITTVLLPLT